MKLTPLRDCKDLNCQKGQSFLQISKLYPRCDLYNIRSSGAGGVGDGGGEEGRAFQSTPVALARWFSWLEHRPIHQKVAGSIPSHGTYLGCRFNL